MSATSTITPQVEPNVFNSRGEWREAMTPEVVAQARRMDWKYLRADEEDEITVYELIPVTMESWIAVIGNPGWANYEWIAREFETEDNRPRFHRSDCGWGSDIPALRDALNALADWF